MSKTYPAVIFVARHGRNIALLAGGMGLVSVGAAAVLYKSALLAAIALAAGLGLWALVRLLAEMVEVIAETLLPR